MGGRSWVGALLWSALRPRPLALGRLVLWPLCPISGFHEASPASRGPWGHREGVSGPSREEVGALGLCTSQGGGTLGVRLAPSRPWWPQ